MSSDTLSKSSAKRPKIYVDSLDSLEQSFHELIPLSTAMGLRADAYDGKSLTVSAPLAPNINHQQSAFGGSLFAVAALAGWGLMQMKLSELMLDCNTVVMGGEVTYSKPVYDDLICTCRLPDDAEAFFERLDVEGKATTQLTCTFECDGEVAMQLQGNYFLNKRKA